MTMEKKYIFLDIDGTLVGYDAQIPPSAIRALKLARANGHRVIIATGRQMSQIYPSLLSALDFDGIIASTGAHVECQGELIYQSVIEGENLKCILDYFKREKICHLMLTATEQYSDGTFGEIVLPYMRRVGYNEDLIHDTYGTVQPACSPYELPGVEKFSYFLAAKTTEEISCDLGGRFYVVDYSIGNIKTEKHFGEITLAGVNKGSAIKRYMAHVGVSTEHAVAVGDSGNDIDMIECCGIGVAMGNATDTIKAAADLITTDVDKDGIYNAFFRLGLIE